MSSCLSPSLALPVSVTLCASLAVGKQQLRAQTSIRPQVFCDFRQRVLSILFSLDTRQVQCCSATSLSPSSSLLLTLCPFTFVLPHDLLQHFRLCASLPLFGLPCLTWFRLNWVQYQQKILPFPFLPVCQCLFWLPFLSLSLSPLSLSLLLSLRTIFERRPANPSDRLPLSLQTSRTQSVYLASFCSFSSTCCSFSSPPSSRCPFCSSLRCLPYSRMLFMFNLFQFNVVLPRDQPACVIFCMHFRCARTFHDKWH